MTIDSWIADAAASTPDKPAIIFNDEPLGYQQMAARIDKAAELLRSQKIGTSDRLAYLGFNHPDIFILLFACAKIGAVFVPLNWRLSKQELSDILADCQPKILLFDEKFAETGRNICPSASMLASEFFVQNRAENPGLEGAAVSEDSALLLVYTSGSTGRPKGVVLSQKAVRANAVMSLDAHQMRADDHILCVLPLFHVGGLNILATPAFFIGATVRLHSVFDPEACLHDCAKSDLVIVVPTILKRLIEQPGWADTDISGLRAISIGSTDVPIELIEAVHARSVPVIQIYGATETSPMAIYQHIAEAFESVGSIGRQGCGCEVEIRDHNARPVRTGEPGEICVRGDNVLMGYWQDEAQTKKGLQEGWFYSGDVAYKDAAGLFWFVDRIKHVIISGGENIYPAEIERVLLRHRDIEEVAVVGQPDGEWGEVPVAVIGASPNADEEQLKSYLHGRLARYKHPRQFYFIDALPRNAMGKIVAEEVKKEITRPATSSRAE